MDHLRDSMRKTINLFDSWIVGRTFIEDGKGFLKLDDGDETQLR
jgi:hypothetical protein